MQVDICLNTCHILGVISTELGRHLKGPIFACFFAIAKFLIKTPFHGAQTTLYCALEPSWKMNRETTTPTVKERFRQEMLEMKKTKSDYGI